MMRSAGPRPKLRVTLRSCTPVWPQEAQRSLRKVDRDNEELSARPDFDDCFSLRVVEGVPSDDIFDLAALPVALMLDDLAREDDTFEVEDREAVMVEFLCGMKGYDIVQ